MTSDHLQLQSSLPAIVQSPPAALGPGNIVRYFVARRAYICQVRRHCIILDVHNNQYLCIPLKDFAALGPLIHGWRDNTHDVASPTRGHCEDVQGLKDQLLAKGVLCESREAGRELSESPITRPISVLDVEHVSVPMTRQMLHAPSFFLACTMADRWLRQRTFESTLQSARALKARHAHHAECFDFQRARILVATFHTLRLWYPRACICLFDSLALLGFLSLHGVYPRWTFGVMADPFQAHCWLQEESVLFNDTLARVSAYTPIMMV